MTQITAQVDDKYACSFLLNDKIINATGELHYSHIYCRDEFSSLRTNLCRNLGQVVDDCLYLPLFEAILLHATISPFRDFTTSLR